MKTISCADCNWRFYQEEGLSLEACPNCRRRNLSEVETGETFQPELVLPYAVDQSGFAVKAREFTGRIPYPPEDLTPGNLIRRARRIFLPQYLVDASVDGSWKAEMGFDYQVVSHQEHLEDGDWQTLEREETRVRWEPRAGTIRRTYQNIRAPALEDDRVLMRALGPLSMGAAEPYAGLPPETWVRLPDRSTEDAWLDAVPGFLEAGMEECRVAAAADHVRGFAWNARYGPGNWTQLLVPAIATYYLDDEGSPQRLLMNGQTGALSGPQRASMKRAQGTALRILLAAFLIFVLGMVGLAFGAVFPPAIILGGGALGAAFIVGSVAVVPVFRAWRFNKDR